MYTLNICFKNSSMNKITKFGKRVFACISNCLHLQRVCSRTPETNAVEQPSKGIYFIAPRL